MFQQIVYNMRIARGSNNNYDWISNANDNEVGKIRTENIEIDYVPTLYTTGVATSNEISNDNSGTKSSVIVNDSGSNGFITFSTDSTENMRLISGGNLGIGITNPSQKLEVNGTIQTTGFKLTTGAVNSYVLTADANGVGTWQASTGGGSGGASDKIFEDNSSIEVIDTGSNGYIIFKTDNTENMRLVSGGNLGIGVTNPTQKLDVNGTAKATLFSGNLNGHTVTATNYYVGSRNVISASAQGSFTDIELKNNETGVLAFGETGNMQLTGTLSVDTIDEEMSNNGVIIEGISLKNKVLDGGVNSTVTASNFNVGTRNIVSAAAQGSFRDLELKLSGGTAKLLAQGDTGNMQLSGILSVDTINENTTASGVTIENVLLKDGNIGIGLTNPSYNIDVNGTVKATTFTKSYR